jgi:hypothetical protein
LEEPKDWLIRGLDSASKSYIGKAVNKSNYIFGGIRSIRGPLRRSRVNPLGTDKSIEYIELFRTSLGSL